MSPTRAMSTPNWCLHAAAIEYDNYDQAIIVTSDGDFACLIEFLIKRKKLKKIIAPTGKYSSLIGQYRDYISS